MRIAPRALHLLRDKRKRAYCYLAVVVLLLVFEVTVRHLPPDGVTVVREDYSTVTTPAVVMSSRTTLATSAQTRAAIDRLNSALNDTPPTLNLPERGCMGLGWVDFQITFTWHGLPIEVWTNAACPNYTENSGGIPDIVFCHTLSPADQQALLALQPPNEP